MTRFVIGAAILLAVVSRFLTIYIRLRELLPSFVSGVPRKGSGGYTAPTADESALMAGAFSYMLEGTLDSTQRAALASKNYYVRTYRDRDSDQETDILTERQHGRKSDGWVKGIRWDHAWGLYILSPNSPSGIIVEVPHPVYDTEAELLGVEGFLHGHAKCLFVAGAHRYANVTVGDADETGIQIERDGKWSDPQIAADVAHFGFETEDTASVFQAIHIAAILGLRAAGRVPTVVQFHSFDSANHSLCSVASAPSGKAVVVSSGSAMPTPLSTRVAERLRAGSIPVYEFGGIDGTACDLGGTHNLQHSYMRRIGAADQFLHIEVGSDVRIDPLIGMQRVARTVMDAINRVTVIGGPPLSI